jgi:hypothetical protein
MDIDPIDDGPKVIPPNPDAVMATSTTAKIVISEEDEARQAIDLMRGDDVAGRVAAANRLEAVAAALGPERTRDVSLVFDDVAVLKCCRSTSGVFDLLYIFCENTLTPVFIAEINRNCFPFWQTESTMMTRC